MDGAWRPRAAAREALIVAAVTAVGAASHRSRWSYPMECRFERVLTPSMWHSMG